MLILALSALLVLLIPSTITYASLVISALLVAYVYLRIAIKPKNGGRGLKLPSLYTIAIVLLPIFFAILVAIEGYRSWQHLFLTMIAAGLTLTFWYNFLTIPLAVYHKIREVKEAGPATEYPTVSIIVPAYNEEKVIAKTIESLIEADYPSKEIIVVDDGSTDMTLEIAKQYTKYGVKVYHKENGGKWSAINYGLKFAKGDVVVTTDADCVVGRDSLKELVKRFSDPKVVAVAGNIKVLNRENLITKCQALEYVLSISIFRRALDLTGAVPVVPGSLGAFRRRALQGVGLYDKDTFVEDFDLTTKLLKMGSTVQASTFALAYTEAPATLRDLYRQRMRWYRGNLQTHVKHRDAFTNPRYSFLQRLSLPFILTWMTLLPVAGVVVLAASILAVLSGAYIQVATLFLVFVALQMLQSLIALEIDEEDRKLAVYAPLFVIGYKQLIDFFTLKAVFDLLTKRKGTWTRVRRIGYLQQKEISRKR